MNDETLAFALGVVIGTITTTIVWLLAVFDSGLMGPSPIAAAGCFDAARNAAPMSPADEVARLLKEVSGETDQGDDS